MLILIFFLQRVYASQSSSLSNVPHAELVADDVYRVYMCLMSFGVNVCKTRPSPYSIFECAKSSNSRTVEIPIGVWHEIFNNLYEPRDHVRPFQRHLIDEMSSRITRRSAYEEDVVFLQAEIINKTITDNGLKVADIFDVYCHYSSVNSIMNQVLRVAHSSYNDLKALVKRITADDLVIDDIRTKVYSIKLRLLRSVQKSYNNAKFLIKPNLSELIGSVLMRDFDQGKKLRRFIQQKIVDVLKELESSDDAGLRESALKKIEKDPVFEILVLEELEYLHSLGKMSMWHWITVGLLVLLSVLVIVVGILNLCIHIRTTRRTSLYQNLGENCGESETVACT